MRTDFSEVKSVFGFRVRLGNPDLDFENLNPDFPIERTSILLCKCGSIVHHLITAVIEQGLKISHPVLRDECIFLLGK